MSDKIGVDEAGVPAAQAPPLSPGDGLQRNELRFGLSPVDDGGLAKAVSDAAIDHQWARPERPGRDDVITSARHIDEQRRWAALPDGKRSRMRSLMTQLGTAVARLRPGGDAAAMDEIDGAVSALSAALDLGTEPHVVACSNCGRIGMAGATICGFCWARLRPAE